MLWVLSIALSHSHHVQTWEGCKRSDWSCLSGPIYLPSMLQEVEARGGRWLLGIADHGRLPGNPGWLLRNSLLLAAARFGVSEVAVACIRLRRGKPSAQHSLLLSVCLPNTSQGVLLI